LGVAKRPCGWLIATLVRPAAMRQAEKTVVRT
jgi:hypothetical protein